jgi:hypothetical protein
MKLRPFLFVAVHVLLADAPRLNAQTPRLPMLVPGASELNQQPPVEGSTRFVVYQRAASGDTAERRIGLWTVDWRVGIDRGQATIYQVNTFVSMSGQAIVDSVVTRQRGLVPVSEISHQPTKTIRLQFQGTRVRAEVTPADSTMRRVERELPDAPFNSSDLLLLVTSVPLRTGYAATVPSYTEEFGGSELDTLRVERRETIVTPTGQRSAWVVTYAEGTNSSRFWLDEKDRRVLRYETFGRKGGSHRMVPVPSSELNADMGDVGEDVLVPASTQLTMPTLHDETRNYRYLLHGTGADTTVRDLGTWHSEQHPGARNGKSVVLLVTRAPDGTQPPFSDSALVVQRTLSPLSETMRSGSTATYFEYDGARVRRVNTKPDSSDVSIEHQYQTPVFHFNELDLVIRSLPFRAGYRAILPLYSEGTDLLEMDSVRVEGKTATGNWRVRFADPVIVTTFELNETTREILSQEAVQKKSGRKVSRVAVP